MKWQAIKRNPPKTLRTVLIFLPDEKEQVCCGYKANRTWHNVHGEIVQPTHWMELPDPPAPAALPRAFFPSDHTPHIFAP